MNKDDLLTSKCKPCEGGVAALGLAEAQNMIAHLHSDWQLSSDTKMISREIKFKNFVEALAFVNKLGELAESEGHHPDIVLKWGYVRIDLWTHAIGGLSENDFIVAAKADSLI